LGDLIIKLQVMENESGAFTSAIWNVKPGKEEEFIRLWTELAQRANETGHVSAHLFREKENSSKFISIGKWPNEETIRKWTDSDEYKNQISIISDLLTEAAQPHLVSEVAKVGEAEIV
jgi:heme-degrading monooxygenase HmoA